MIVSSSQDRVYEFWCPSDSLPDFTKANYFRQTDSITQEIEFVENNNKMHEYLPVLQSSLIIDQDNIVAYTYIIDENAGQSEDQVGHWKALTK